MRRETMHSIPNEIQDRILDFLHDSKPALRACALVCKTWLPTSRYHLFHVILVTSRTVDYLMDIFENPNCTIRSCTELFVRWNVNSPRTATIANALQLLSTRLKPSSLKLRLGEITHKLQSALALFQSVERLVIIDTHLWEKKLQDMLFPTISPRSTMHETT